MSADALRARRNRTARARSDFDRALDAAARTAFRGLLADMVQKAVRLGTPRRLETVGLAIAKAFETAAMSAPKRRRKPRPTALAPKLRLVVDNTTDGTPRTWDPPPHSDRS